MKTKSDMFQFCRKYQFKNRCTEFILDEGGIPGFLCFYESGREGAEGGEKLSDLLHGPEAVLSDHAVHPG